MALVTSKNPVSTLAADGTKVTFTVQLAPAANVAVQVLPLSPNPEVIPVASIDSANPVNADTLPGLVTVTCTGTVKHLGRRTALAEAVLTSHTGKLLATATSSCLILNP